jgi:phosphatidylserine decarboxylase
LADEYKGGTCLVFRLTVDDYHHYHYFDNGTSEKEVIIPGIFHTVNPIANDYYPIYKTNTRHYTMIHSENFDDVVYMEVGALMVGKIVNANKKEFKRGEEKGYFEFGGSTVVLLFKKDILNVDEDIIQHSKNHDEVKVKLGERVAIHL